MKYPNELLKYRERADMTQQEVGVILGVSQQAYQAYESGNRELRGNALIKLRNKFGCTVDDLLGNRPLDESARPLDPNESTLVINYRDLNDEGQEHLVTYSHNLTHVPEYKKDSKPEMVQENAG
jgi:transcriptional regulator with XRE-family HTH domain